MHDFSVLPAMDAADAAMACPDVWPNVATGVHPSIVAMAEQIRTCGCSASTCTVLAELLQMDATKQQIEAERQHMQARLQVAISEPLHQGLLVYKHII